MQWALQKHQIVPRSSINLQSKNYFVNQPPQLEGQKKRIYKSKQYLRKTLSPNWFEEKHNLYQLEEVFEVVGLHPPTRGDGPRSRHDEFMTTELLGYFDELFTDDKYISNLKLNEEEEFFACLDRGVSDLSDYFDAKTLASRHIPEAQNLSYETI